MDDLSRMNLLKQVSVTTNKALVLSSNVSQRSSPTNDLSDSSVVAPETAGIMNAVTVDKLSIADLEKQLNSETDLSDFLDQIEASRSLPFTKNPGTLEDDEDEFGDQKFQIRIRVKEEANLRIASVQLLSSEEMFELHCGETNEYLSSVYADFIDKVDQQFVIYYGCHSLLKAGSSGSSMLRSESSMKKSLNIVFPKFNSSVKDTIWIFAVKLNLVECRSTNLNSSAFNSMGSMLPLMQMFAGGANRNDSNKPLAADLPGLLNQLNSKASAPSLPQLISQFLPSNSSRDYSVGHFGQQSEIDLQNNLTNQNHHRNSFISGPA